MVSIGVSQGIVFFFENAQGLDLHAPIDCIEGFLYFSSSQPVFKLPGRHAETSLEVGQFLFCAPNPVT